MSEPSGQSLDDAIRLNQTLAYQGKLGQGRAAFCRAFIEKKKAVLQAYQADQVRAVSCAGEKISCRLGCIYCCMAYMQTSVQECEAIVYYLYQHPAVMKSFLASYPAWRQRLTDTGDIYEECGQLWQLARRPGAGEPVRQALGDALKRYRQQEIACPFLTAGTCSIYEVRPYTCAALVAFTPPEYCHPAKARWARTYLTPTPEVFDTSFYYKQMHEGYFAFMPVVVYNLLVFGYAVLASIPGLESIEAAARQI